MAYRTFPVVLAAPSGTGKTTLARALVRAHDHFAFSTSATTRAPRPGEQDGADYHFLERAEFEAMATGGSLAEWAEVHGELYGTPRRALEEAVRAGVHAVLDIDVQGARQVKDALPEAVTVFILPPSVEALLERLKGRRSEDGAGIAKRLRTALAELEAAVDFDYIVVNDDLDRCLDELLGIVDAEAHRAARAEGLARTLEEMREGVAALLRDQYTDIT